MGRYLCDGRGTILDLKKPRNRTKKNCENIYLNVKR